LPILPTHHIEARVANLRVSLEKTHRNGCGVSREAHDCLLPIDSNNLALIVTLPVALETSITDLHLLLLSAALCSVGVFEKVCALLLSRRAAAADSRNRQGLTLQPLKAITIAPWDG
jgi:hypothetical protein